METKIGMIAAVSEALTFRKSNPKSSNEDIIQHIANIAMGERDITKKMGMIAAASRAVAYVERNPAATEKEVIKYVMNETSNIANNIDIQEK